MSSLLRLLVLGCCLSGLLSAAPSERVTRQFVTRVETCEAILREFMADPATAIPEQILKEARGLIIVNQIKAGAILGVREGYATILVKRKSGQWSVPVLMNAGEASLGLQLGGSRIELIYVLMNDEVPKLLSRGRFRVGVDARALAGPRIGDLAAWNRAPVPAPVYVYSRQNGLFVGAAVKSGYLTRSDELNRAYYEQDYDLPELLYGEWIQGTEAVRPLVEYVTKICP